MATQDRALVVIDLQNDYFPGGAFPLWNPEQTLANTLAAMELAQTAGVPVILVQHIAQGAGGPFFNPDTTGVEIHRQVLNAAQGARIVVKRNADAFLGTELEETLAGLGVHQLLVCGMMTQNCVTHTAISRSAEKYDITVLGDCCTTVSEMIHLIALNALAPRVRIATAREAFSPTRRG
jgi:nicotinamidase-related amidase